MAVSSDSDSFSLPDNRRIEKQRLPTIGLRPKSNDEKTLDSPGPSPAISIDTTENTNGRDRSLASRLRRNRNPLASLFTSTLFHVFTLLMLLLFSWRSPPDRVISLLATIESVPVVAPAEIISNDPSELSEAIDAFETPLTDTAEDTSDAPEEMAEELIDIVEPQLTVAEVMPSAESILPAIDGALDSKPIAVGGSLSGRNSDSRAALAAKRGGSPASEQAVENALRWIVAHQDRYDGGWRFQQKCGQCKNDGECKSRSAATGLALMALLGAGYTHREGPYQESVDSGLKYLVSHQKHTPEYGGSFIDDSSGMYVHAIATIAMAEAFTMTEDPQLKEPLVEAHRYIVAAQNRQGGWRYNPGSAGDVLVTGWQVIALKSLERAGIETPQSVYDRVSVFLKSCEKSGGGYRYIPQESKIRPSPTAASLLSQMYLGVQRYDYDLEHGCDYLLDQGVSKTDIYFDFKATMALHHFQHESWDEWNKEMRDYLVSSQETAGHQAGSWHFPDKHGNVGGRLYTTAMAAMTLEVYYRYSPLFELAE